ncbi:MAG: hypothetical protein ACUVQ0_06480 [Thermoproteota archaeon]
MRLITNPGIKDIVEKEVEQVLGVKASVFQNLPGRMLIEIGKKASLKSLCERSL